MVLACHDKFVRLTFEKPISGKIVKGVHADKRFAIGVFQSFYTFLHVSSYCCCYPPIDIHSHHHLVARNLNLGRPDLGALR